MTETNSVIYLHEHVEDRPMRVGCFMSGSGTNVIKIIERSLRPDASYSVELILTDVNDERRKKSGDKRCKALDISKHYNKAYECEDIRDFYHSKGHKTIRDLSLRPDFYEMVVEKIKPYDLDVIALGGFMSIVTDPLLSHYAGRIYNVHPADLSIMEDGKRKYVGANVVLDAILAGATELRSSTHIVRQKVDYGEILLISEPLEVKLPEGLSAEDLRKGENKKLAQKISDEHQDRLKEIGDWEIFPLTIQWIGESRFSIVNGKLHFGGNPIPYGYRLRE